MATLSGAESGVAGDFNLAKAKMSQLDENALEIVTLGRFKKWVMWNFLIFQADLFSPHKNKTLSTLHKFG